MQAQCLINCLVKTGKSMLDINQQSRVLLVMIEILFWSLVVITWASYGMHVIKEYIRNHIQ